MNQKSARRLVSLATYLLVGGLSAAAAAPIMEVGRLTVHSTFDEPTFTSANFQQTYTRKPLVFTLPTNNGSDPATLRLRNVTSNGFQVVQAEPPGEDGPHVEMNTNYLAIVPGVYDFGGGLVVEAGYIDTTTTVRQQSPTGGFDSIEFTGPFEAAPALLVDVQTMRNETAAEPPPVGPSTPWLTAHARNVGRDGAEVALERAEVDDGSVVSQNERIGYVAFSQGNFSFDALLGDQIAAITIESLITGQTIRGWDNTSGNGNRVDLNGAFANAPLVFANMASRNGNNGGWLRRGDVTSSSVDLMVDEDRYANGERSHITEIASVIAFSEAFTYATSDLSGPSSGFGPADVPEPGGLILLGVGLAALGFQRRARKVS